MFPTMLMSRRNFQLRQRLRASAEAGWALWSSVSEGRSTPGAPITAVVTGQNRVALFLANPNGGIYTTSGSAEAAEAEQLSRVVMFRSELSQNGLVKEYRDANEFADIIRRDLLWLVGRMVNVDRSPVDAARRVGELALGSATSTVRQQILDLAREYERIRADMPAGDQRTRRMEIIVTRMRTIATEVYPLLESFHGAVHQVSA